MHVQEMYRRLTGLVVFRRLLQDPVVAACGEMLSARVRGDSGDFSAACAGFEAALFQSSDSWSCYLRETVLESENVCIRGQAVGRSSVLQDSLRRELAFFDQLSQLQLEDLTAGLREPPEFLVGWVVSPTDITREYLRRMEEVGVKGYGIFRLSIGQSGASPSAIRFHYKFPPAHQVKAAPPARYKLQRAMFLCSKKIPPVFWNEDARLLFIVCAPCRHRHRHRKRGASKAPLFFKSLFNPG